ncbi:MAG: GAF domain-containing protein, partial [Anaerolineae bacterium]|nr:GAF domain-containing protein [Anaerolineae bacterium]
QGLVELSVLYEASTIVSTNWNTQEVLDTLIRQIVDAINVSQGYIVSWNRSQSQGIIKSQFMADDEAINAEAVKLAPNFNLNERPALLTALSQQRVVLFESSNPLLNEAEQLDMGRHGCFSRLVIPLIVKGSTIGWAELWETRPGRHFTVDEIRLARMLSIQTAVALENAQYLQQMQQTLEETTALYHVSSALATTQDPLNIMNIVLQEYLRVLELKQGRVIIFDFKNRTGITHVNLIDDRFHDSGYSPGQLIEPIALENNPLYGRLMQTRKPVMIEDTDAEWLTRAHPGLPPPNPVKGTWVGKNTLSMLVIPIHVREEIVGVIIAEDTEQVRLFDAWATSLGQAMADQLGIALQNVELYELESKRRHQAETLREVSTVVGSSLNLDEVLERILDQLRRVIAHDSAAIHLVEGHRRRIIAARGFPDPAKVIGLTFPAKLDKNEPGSIAIHNRKPFVIDDISAIGDAFKGLPHGRIKSWMGIPLIAREKVVGLITVDRIEKNTFSDEERRLTQAFANQVAIALENARLYEIEVREIERELEIAHEIQETLLPQFAPQVPDLQISGRMTPVHQIGGDYFHFFSIDDQFGLAIGDVSGKGIPAALYMAAVMTAIDAELSHKNPGPGQLLQNLHQILYKRLQQNRMNIGLQVATFTPLPLPPGGQSKYSRRGKIMTVANAGMISPIVANDQGCQFLSTAGLPLGAPISDPDYEEGKILLEPGTFIIFTSDGIVEAQNELGELFGFERLETTVAEFVDTKDAEQMAEHIIYKAQEFMGEAEEQHDDMTVVVVLVEDT